MFGLVGTARKARWFLMGLISIISVSPSDHALLLNAAAQTLPVRAPERVKEEMFVRIGDIDQWITITGDDRNNPVVLFLHGGPGDAWSPFADAMFAGWEKDFTLVQWDQRGAGRTYGKSGPSIEATMTVERMAQDGVEVAEFLTRELHKKKIIILKSGVLEVIELRSKADLIRVF
jgi:pimeloyl-ACP methyl ester carboxylesterase